MGAGRDVAVGVGAGVGVGTAVGVGAGSLAPSAFRVKVSEGLVRLLPQTSKVKNAASSGSFSVRMRATLRLEEVHQALLQSVSYT